MVYLEPPSIGMSYSMFFIFSLLRYGYGNGEKDGY